MLVDPNGTKKLEDNAINTYQFRKTKTWQIKYKNINKRQRQIIINMNKAI